MIHRDLLEGKTIIDFSLRLPGPLAGYLLTNLGAKVIKIEDQRFKDPFIEGLFPQMDESFKSWYQALNQNKDIQRFDFNSPQDQEVIRELISNADGIIYGPPIKVEQKLSLGTDFLKDSKLGVVIPKASFSHKESMHDLNALSISGILELHCQEFEQDIIAPPFLPLAGINFGHHLAMDLIAAMWKSSEQKQTVITNTYLLESTEESFSPFWPKEIREGHRKFLHNGKYPCYAIYKTKDQHYVALASVEEKFWLRFCELFSIDLTPESRFHFQDDSIFQLVAKKIKTYSREEIADIISDEDICLSLI